MIDNQFDEQRSELGENLDIELDIDRDNQF